MDTVSMFLILVVILCVTIFYFSKRKHPNMPPEPFGYPILGHIPFFKPTRFMAHTNYKKYGPICTLREGPRQYVLLNSYDAIHEAFVKQADAYAGRTKNAFFEHITHGSGILFQDGSLWQEHRRFILRLLREFGSGREVGENIILDECAAIKEDLLRSLGEPINTKALYTKNINNVISRLTFGERCGSDDAEFVQFTKCFDDIIKFSLIDMLPVMFPFIVKCPTLLKWHERISTLCQRFQFMHGYIQNKIEKHRSVIQQMDPPPTEVDQASSVCEAIIIEQNRQESANPGKHTFTEWQLIRDMFELFIAGTETTTTALTWATVLLATHPEIQARVRQEINETIGRDRAPKMADKQHLPYLSAVMDEVMRYSSIAPHNVEHRTVTETELMGFTIPADMTIVTNLYGIHHDPSLWEKPNEFYPEHFLTPEGEYRSNKHLIPFSLGKRACLGESLARLEYFLGLVTIMQTFEVRLVKSEKTVEEILFGTDGMTHAPLPHEIIFNRLE